MDAQKAEEIRDEITDCKVLLAEMAYEGGAWNSATEAKQNRTVVRMRELELQLEEAGLEY